MKHTPEPWKIIDDDMDYIAITDVDQNFGICKLEETSNENRKAMVANAHLIAAAPDMLEALRKARVVVLTAIRIASSSMNHQRMVEASEALEAIDAAILKARGQS